MTDEPVERMTIGMNDKADDSRTAAKPPRAAADDEHQVFDSDDYRLSLLADIRLMLAFARETGKVLDGDLPEQLKDLALGLPLNALVRVHGKLCDLIKPATPATLAATEPVQRPGSSSRSPNVPLYNAVLAWSLCALFLHLTSTAWLAALKQGTVPVADNAKAVAEATTVAPKGSNRE